MYTIQIHVRRCEQKRCFTMIYDEMVQKELVGSKLGKLSFKNIPLQQALPFRPMIVHND